MGRKFRCINWEVELFSLELHDHYMKMIEIGSAEGLRSFRLRQLEKEIAEASGLFVHNLNQLRADCNSGSPEWMPSEEIRATLWSIWVPADKDPSGSSYLTVIWFQDEGTDPFERLAEILRNLDWTALAAYQPERH